MTYATFLDLECYKLTVNASYSNCAKHKKPCETVSSPLVPAPRVPLLIIVLASSPLLSVLAPSLECS